MQGGTGLLSRGARTLALGVALLGIALLTSVWAGVARADDLESIRRRGHLRVVLPRYEASPVLPAAGRPLEAERSQAVALAQELGVSVRWVYVDGFDEVIRAIADGRGDLAAENLTVTPSRRERVAFTAPVAVVRELVVARRDGTRLRGPADLAGRRIGVRRSSSHWERLQALAQEFPDITVEAVDEDQSLEHLLARVAQGDLDLTLADSNLLTPLLPAHPELRAAFALPGMSLIAWALAPDAPKLRRAVDGFLTRIRQDRRFPGRSVGDLAAIRERGVLRVLTRSNAAHHYVWNGRILGFEYELAREFARRLGVELEVVVPPSHADLVPWLRKGRGDLIAASLLRSPERAEALGVSFSERTQRVRPMVVARRDEASLADLTALEGRRIHVRRSSAHWQILHALRASGLAIEIEAVPEDLETEEIIEGVALGVYDLTVADSHIVDIALAWRDDVRAALPLSGSTELGWAVRRHNPELRAEIDAFFRKEYRGTFYNVLAKRYFRSPARIRLHAENRASRAGRLSPFDELLRRYASRYGFDWRLIAAQMHQESKFDPRARSFAGARGLLQVMPRTARSVGLPNVEHPETGIHAGIRYLARLRGRLEDSLSVADRNWLALAAYNAGEGHLADARRLARERGLDPNRWFGHVETAMLAKRSRSVAAKSPMGYCRCDEPVRYVRAVRDRYLAYVQVAGEAVPPRRALESPVAQNAIAGPRTADATR
ncbi:MAG: transporter substrate-binding domain-containing protein [Myxococcota bacterium]